jgi:transposase InsO family protein
LLESFGTVGDCFDNAVMESLWGRMQTELLDTRKWSTTMELTVAMADYIDNFYNTEPRHGTLTMKKRLGHSTMRAALGYQHATEKRDQEIAKEIDRRLAAMDGDSDDDGSSVVRVPVG